MNTNTTSRGLVRELGPFIATAIIVGTVIGSGIFKKPQGIALNVEFFGLTALAWILGGLLAFMGALAYAEVATLYPQSGGNYVFLREGYGRLFGFLWGWVDFFIIRSASIAALATLFTQSLHDVLKEVAPSTASALGFWPQRFITVGIILGLAWVNVRGVRWGGTLQLLITIVKVSSLVFLIVLPFIAIYVSSVSDVRTPDASRLTPVWPNREDLTPKLLSGFFSALLGVLWAYHGWMNLAPIAGEVKNPQRNIPLALLLGTLIVIALYLLTNLSYSLILNRQEMMVMKEGMSEDKTVGIGFCRILLGPVGVLIAASAVMCSVFGALNGNLLVGPRLLFAMSEDRLAPQVLGEVHARYRTPALAIVSFASWSVVLVLGVAVLTSQDLLDPSKDHFDILTSFAMFGALIFETMAVMSIFVFRKKLPNVERPYRCWGYPVVPALYIILPAMVLTNMFIKERQEALFGVAFILIGTAVYFVVEWRAKR